MVLIANDVPPELNVFNPAPVVVVVAVTVAEPDDQRPRKEIM